MARNYAFHGRNEMETIGLCKSMRAKQSDRNKQACEHGVTA